MNLEFLKEVLAVPTESLREDQMVQFILEQASKYPKAGVHLDKYNNIFIRKGMADVYPCVAAHIDSVQPVHRKFSIEQTDGLLIGVDRRGRQVGFGGDDKSGVYICLEMLARFDNIAVTFFAAEEIGCQGAIRADARMFEDLGYMLEFDCPAHDMMSYTSSGIRLFANDGDFIKTAHPVLNQFGVTKWQHHPYSDVLAMRKRFDFSCMNLSSGYYNWHRKDECVKIADTANSLEMATELVRALGNNRYDFARNQIDESAPLMPISQLEWPKP